MDTDILKPNTGYLTVIERPTASSSKTLSDHHSPSGSRSTIDAGSYTEPVSEGEEDEEMDLAPAKDEDKRTGLSGAEVEAAIAYREQMLRERRKSEAASNAPRLHKSEAIDTPEVDDEEGDAENRDERKAYLKTKKVALDNGKSRTLSIDPLAPSSAFDETLKSRLRRERDDRRQHMNEDANEDDEDHEEEHANQGDGRILSRDWAAPAGKRIAVPVRIEPKVYFAAERTFLVSHPLELPHGAISSPCIRNGSTTLSSLAQSPRRFSILCLPTILGG